MANFDILIKMVEERLAAIMGDLRMVSLKSPISVYHFVSRTIQSVESVSSEVSKMTGDQKKSLVVAIMNKYIDIPIAPEWLEEKFFGVLIDFGISLLNNFFGKAWLESVKK